MSRAGTSSGLKYNKLSLESTEIFNQRLQMLIQADDNNNDHNNNNNENILFLAIKIRFPKIKAFSWNSSSVIIPYSYNRSLFIIMTNKYDFLVDDDIHTQFSVNILLAEQTISTRIYNSHEELYQIISQLLK